MTLPNPGQVYVRRDIWELSTAGPWSPRPPWDAYSLAYARAVQEMQRRNSRADDPTSWNYQAAIHGVPDPPDPLPSEWAMCQHSTWFFLPWHRMYIACFEQIVRSIVVSQGGPGDWALPFWNWTVDRALPPAFRERSLPDGSPNPLYVPERNPRMNAGGQLGAGIVRTDYALGFTGFVSPDERHDTQSPTDVGFGGPLTPPNHQGGAYPPGGLEDWPHNHVHDQVGGLMGNPDTAAGDPIFWLHHSNVDRVWVQWLALGGSRVNPGQNDWLDEEFGFFDANGSAVAGHVGEVLDTTQLGYRYEFPQPVATALQAATTGPRPTTPTPTTPTDGGSVDLGAATDVSLGFSPTTVELQLSEQAQAIVDALAGDPREAPPLRLDLDGVELDAHPGVVYAIYLDLPEANEATPHSSDNLVGYLSFFGIGHVHGGEVHGGLRRFDIRSLAAQLDAQGKWTRDRATVTFVPTGPEPPPNEPLHAAGAPPEDAQAAPVHIARVVIASGA